MSNLKYNINNYFDEYFISIYNQNKKYIDKTFNITAKNKYGEEVIMFEYYDK